MLEYYSPAGVVGLSLTKNILVRKQYENQKNLENLIEEIKIKSIKQSTTPAANRIFLSHVALRCGHPSLKSLIFIHKYFFETYANYEGEVTGLCFE